MEEAAPLMNLSFYAKMIIPKCSISNQSSDELPYVLLNIVMAVP